MPFTKYGLTYGKCNTAQHTHSITANSESCSEVLSLKTVHAESAWASLTVHGFENSPISWGNSAHSSLTGGENCYTILWTAGCELLHHDRQENEQMGGVARSQFMTFEIVGSQDEHS